jgi:hypothetical protein
MSFHIGEGFQAKHKSSNSTKYTFKSKYMYAFLSVMKFHDIMLIAFCGVGLKRAGLIIGQKQ